MHLLSRRTSVLLFTLLFVATLRPAFAGDNWTDPTPAELKMTSDPAAPNAAAVYLFREEIVDDKLHYHQVYARIKILTEKGKDEFSDIEIPYDPAWESIRAVEGRTIHADGTIVPFTGKPYDKVLVRSGTERYNAKVFSMPDVQVGSIIEYRWELAYADNYYNPPRWYIQQSVYVHKAHYHFVPVDMSTHPMTATDALGKQRVAHQLAYYQELPAGMSVRQGFDGFDLTVNDIPALPEEDYSPPLSSFSYRVFFYYSFANTGAEFWQDEAKTWSKDVDRFADPSDRIKQAVAQIVAPGDTDDAKLHKIYAAVMGIENTRFTRQRSAAENKAEGLRIRTAADIWEAKRGSDDEITRLFIAMARAAGLRAYAMIVTERDQNILNTGYLYWGQLEDEIAIVNVGGTEVFFDPGQRDCDYGKLHWMHTQVLGIRQTDRSPALQSTPAPSYTDNGILRSAYLELSADGTVTGVARISMSGALALRWRQEALGSDEETVKKDFADELQADVPPGVIVKTNHFIALADHIGPLMAIMDVSGNMGTETSKRVFLPSAFFESKSKPLFSVQTRQSPIDLHYPYLAQDEVTVTLAAGLKVESVPAGDEIPLAQHADYRTKYTGQGNNYQFSRMMALGNTTYPQDQYPQLRDFFQKVGAQDQQQVVLDRVAVTAAQQAVPAAP